MKRQNSIMLAVVLGLWLFGWAISATAQKIQRSRESVLLSNCNDLMTKIRRQYGRAPMCLRVVGPGGQSLTSLNGSVGLSDDMVNFWYVMRISTDAVDPTLYRYSESDLNNVLIMVQYSHRGLTEEDLGRVVASNACAKAISSLKTQRGMGVLTEQEYQLAVSDYKKTVGGCSQ